VLSLGVFRVFVCVTWNVCGVKLISNACCIYMSRAPYLSIVSTALKKDAEFREGLWCSLEHRRKCKRVAVGGDVFVVHCGWCVSCTYLHTCAFCCRTIQPMILDQNYIALKTQVIKAERRVLKELGFCVHVKHPHKVCYVGVAPIVRFVCTCSHALPVCPYNNNL
jgi:hypothetical protein